MYVMVYVKKELEEKLKEIAQRKRKKVSTLVREWTEEKIKEE